MDFLKRTFSRVGAISPAIEPNQTYHASAASDSSEKIKNTVQVIPDADGGTVEISPSCESSFTSPVCQVSNDPSQVTAAGLLHCDRQLVLSAADARKFAPSIGPLLTEVKSVKRSQAMLKVTPVQRQRASPIERAAVCRTEGVKLPRSEPKMLRDKCESEKLRVKCEPEKSEPEKLPKVELEICVQSLPIRPVVPMPVSAVPTPASIDTQTVDMMQAIQGLKEELAKQQKKFSALYTHTRRLAQDIERKDEKLQLLKRGDCAQKLLSDAQTQLAMSTAALHAKNKKTKFISGERKLVNKVTNPSKVVQAEMDKASVRVLKQHRLEQCEDVARLVSIVDELSKKYPRDRYSNISTIILNPMQKEDAISVTTVFKGLCVFAAEPTDQEIEEYDELLARETRPAPIYSPSFPPARVQWSSLNTNYLRNMPKPEAFPVQSCSMEPSLYAVIISKTPRDNVNIGCRRPVITTTVSSFDKPDPFGTLYGFMTDVGVLPVPEMPVHGYSCDPHTGAWVILARAG